MPDEFDDLRDLLHRSSIGSESAETPHATLVAGEAALQRIITGRQRTRTRRRIVAGATVVACSAGLVLAVVPRMGDDAPSQIATAAAPIAPLPFGTPDQTAPAVLAAAERAAEGGTYTADGGREWVTWEPQERRAPTLTSVTVESDGATRVERRDGLALSAEGTITGSIEVIKSRSPFSVDQVDPDPPTSATTESIAMALLAQDCAMESSACALAAITDLATDPGASDVLPPRELWKQLQQKPGIQAFGTTTDRLGRPATAIAADSADGVQRIVLLIDPRTGRYLGTEYLARKQESYAVARFIVIA